MFVHFSNVLFYQDTNPCKMTDQEHVRLINEFKKGQEDAFEQVFTLFYKPLRLQAFLLLKNGEEADDQVQQLFLDIWNKRLYTNVQQSLKAYLHTAIRNRCLTYLTKANKETKMLQEYAVQINSSLPEEPIEQPLQLSLLAILKELPTQRFKAVSLVHLEDKKYQEAAQEMGISVNSLKSHLKLAIHHLRTRSK